jgi:hypothetical protein
MVVDTQEYDFKLEDILGVNNPADGISRLVANNMTPAVIASLYRRHRYLNTYT